MKKLVLLCLSHLVFLGLGFALGIYALPILTAPPAPTDAEVARVAQAAAHTGELRRDLRGSSWLHWGEGTLSVALDQIALAGRIAPGPDYRLYLSPEFVETADDFERLRPRMRRVGEVRTFNNFLVPVPDNIDVNQFNTAIIWCESFGQFITSAQYRP